MTDMPIIEVSIAKGRDRSDLNALMEALHRAANESIGAPEKSIRILVKEIEPELWLSGGQTLAEKQRADAQ